MSVWNTTTLIDKARRSRSWRDGGCAATRYERACPEARKSSFEEDVKMHVDYWHGSLGVDVKGNNLLDEIWVEFRNVKGNLGWVAGEAEWIAFDMPEVNGFVRVDREELLDWCKKNVDFKSVVPKKDAYRKIYQRKDRLDKITMLVISDLMQLESYTVVPYSKEYKDPKLPEMSSIP